MGVLAAPSHSHIQTSGIWPACKQSGKSSVIQTPKSAVTEHTSAALYCPPVDAITFIWGLLWFISTKLPFLCSSLCPIAINNININKLNSGNFVLSCGGDNDPQYHYAGRLFLKCGTVYFLIRWGGEPFWACLLDVWNLFSSHLSIDTWRAAFRHWPGEKRSEKGRLVWASSSRCLDKLVQHCVTLTISPSLPFEWLVWVFVTSTNTFL